MDSQQEAEQVHREEERELAFVHPATQKVSKLTIAASCIQSESRSVGLDSSSPSSASTKAVSTAASASKQVQADQTDQMDRADQMDQQGNNISNNTNGNVDGNADADGSSPRTRSTRIRKSSAKLLSWQESRKSKKKRSSSMPSKSPKSNGTGQSAAERQGGGSASSPITNVSSAPSEPVPMFASSSSFPPSLPPARSPMMCSTTAAAPMAASMAATAAATAMISTGPTTPEASAAGTTTSTTAASNDKDDDDGDDDDHQDDRKMPARTSTHDDSNDANGTQPLHHTATATRSEPPAAAAAASRDPQSATIIDPDAPLTAATAAATTSAKSKQETSLSSSAVPPSSFYAAAAAATMRKTTRSSGAGDEVYQIPYKTKRFYADIESMDKIEGSPYEANESAEVGEDLFDAMKALLGQFDDDSDSNDEGDETPQTKNHTRSSSAKNSSSRGNKNDSKYCTDPVEVFGEALAGTLNTVYEAIGKSGMLYSHDWQNGRIRGMQTGYFPKTHLLLCLHEQRFLKASHELLAKVAEDLETSQTVRDVLVEYGWEARFVRLASVDSSFYYDTNRRDSYKSEIFVARAARCMALFNTKHMDDSVREKVLACLEIMSQSVRVSPINLDRINKRLEAETPSNQTSAKRKRRWPLPSSETHVRNARRRAEDASPQTVAVDADDGVGDVEAATAVVVKRQDQSDGVKVNERTRHSTVAKAPAGPRGAQQDESGSGGDSDSTSSNETSEYDSGLTTSNYSSIQHSNPRPLVKGKSRKKTRSKRPRAPGNEALTAVGSGSLPNGSRAARTNGRHGTLSRTAPAATGANGTRLDDFSDDNIPLSMAVKSCRKQCLRMHKALGRVERIVARHKAAIANEVREDVRKELVEELIARGCLSLDDKPTKHKHGSRSHRRR